MSADADTVNNRARAWIARWGLSAFGLAFSLAIVLRTHRWFVAPFVVPVSNDEGYIAAMALRMIRGHWLPYVDGVSQRGPLLYWISALFLRAGGIWSWLPMRALGATLAVLQVGLSFALGVTLAGRTAGALCALVVTHLLCFEMIPWDGVGVNGEPLGAVFALGSALALARMQLRETTETRRARLAFASGALCACGALSKQMFLVHALPAALWIALGPARDEGLQRSRAERARDAMRFALGFATPFALVLSLYAATGNLRRFVYYFQQYGRQVFMAPVTWAATREAFRPQIDRSLTLVGAVSLGWFALVARALRSGARANAPALFVAANLALGMAGACFTTRFFGHYFVQVFPWLGLLAAMLSQPDGDEGATRGDPRRAWALVLGAIAVVSLGHYARGRQVLRSRVHDRWYQDPSDDPISRYVRENSRPEQSVFVWGFRAETYLSAERWPASRYVYTVYPAGVVPWFSATREEQEQRVVPGSREELLEDLEREKPELLVDAGRTMLDQYMYNYPVFRAYIDRHYCFARYVDGEPVYRRKRDDRCPGAAE
jgi:hypothetical protein